MMSQESRNRVYRKKLEVSEAVLLNLTRHLLFIRTSFYQVQLRQFKKAFVKMFVTVSYVNATECVLARD